MTPRWFAARVKAYDEARRTEFDLLRVQTFLICAPNLRKHATLKRFWPSPWEEQIAAVEWGNIDPAAMANFNAHADAAFEAMRQQTKEHGVN